MDFSIIFQLRTKRFWWLDVIFYFVISLLIATVLCYLIFLIKVGMQNKSIKDLEVATEAVGTGQQRENEEEVLFYQKKIADFAGLIKNHQFASSVFSFMEEKTLPSAWFNLFNLNRKDASVGLSGEADDMDVLSRQIAAMEKSEYVKKIALLNSQINSTGGIKFNLNLNLDPKIFNILPLSLTLPSIEETTTSSSQPVLENNQQ
jgi:hypothetical protein